jgi:cell wall-associated NlpC family hydrolase
MAAPAASANSSGATLNPDGTATPPPGAPAEVVAAINAANEIEDLPYEYGGGHKENFTDNGYDCSGAVSYALHAAGLLDSPLDSSGLMQWGERGRGSWITVYSNPGHVHAVIAGLRWDTSMTPGNGPGWSEEMRPGKGFKKRHWTGL